MYGTDERKERFIDLYIAAFLGQIDAYNYLAQVLKGGKEVHKPTMPEIRLSADDAWNGITIEPEAPKDENDFFTDIGEDA